MKFLLLPLFIVTTLSLHAQELIHLWEDGAPGFEDRKDIPERAKDWWIKDIHNPSITVFLPPADIATGAAVLIAPGGGHKELVFNAEGVEAAEFFNSIGVAAFALKYRLCREPNSPYDLAIHPQEDGQRAMRLIRSRASEWGIDPDRLGMIGFSAGGEVLSLVTFSETAGNPQAKDPVERMNAKPDFNIYIYPGAVGIPEHLPKDTAPTFMLTANDDLGAARNIQMLYNKLRAAGVPLELHIYQSGGHAFNMGNRSERISFQDWPNRITHWMTDNDMLIPSK